MSIEVKNVLISDPLDKSAIEILNKANINVQINTGLNPQQLIEEIKVSIFIIFKSFFSFFF